MRDSVAPERLELGIEGFSYPDLFIPARLKELAERFYWEVESADPELALSFASYRKERGTGLNPVQESEVIVRLAPYLGWFVARLFRVGMDAARDRDRAESEKPISQFKEQFIIRRALKAYGPSESIQLDRTRLEEQMRALEESVLGPLLPRDDREDSVARTVVSLMEIEKTLIRKVKGQEVDAGPSRARLAEICGSLSAQPSFSSANPLFPGSGPIQRDEAGSEVVRSLLRIAEQWVCAHFHQPEGRRAVSEWASFKLPEKLDFLRLVETVRTPDERGEFIQGPEETRRRREGFVLTDRRYTLRQTLSEVHYCIFCHEREKDSCSKGLHEKDGALKENPLGIPLTGCPLNEKISEAHLLKRDGETIAALAVMMIDNPAIPATGHRICNDCMKGCIYQKQDPVNIPQIETRILTDVLDLPWGFEIYDFLTRWNPLNVQRPYLLPYNGKNILVVGMGPAGFSLAQLLLNDGFGVCGVDGLKIEPLPQAWVGDERIPPQPIRSVQDLYEELDERTVAGFGGVAEYGITVRWDKNFLRLIYLTLARRSRFRVYGGVRFGGTLTVEDAWELGFDHIAVATGAGRPTLVEMKNNLIRGVRMASDFLMALQLTGAAKRSSMASLQVRLPAVVIGGGLTAIDTATELMAYYPVQVEKVRDRVEILTREIGRDRVWERFDEEERRILQEFLAHAEALRIERERAKAAGTLPDLARLVQSWGGVSILYRKAMTDSPAYRLNHEEIIKSLEEGIYFVENMNPVECVPDPCGSVQAVRFERQKQDERGKWRSTGEIFTFPAKGVFIAAGTSPNIVYEKERPGTFRLDEQGKFFQKFEPRWNGSDIPELIEKKAPETLTSASATLFTSYRSAGRLITFYGDNHPTFAGNVVKAIASAKKGFAQISRLFASEITPQNGGEPHTDGVRFESLVRRLDEGCLARVHRVNRLTSTIVEVVVRAPFQARGFLPGQFYRLQNYESAAAIVEGTRLAMEGVALTGAWVDRKEGLLSLIALELGHSSRLCATLKPGEPVVVMGPTGSPTHLPPGNETVVLAGGGLGNAVLFSIGKALREKGNRVLYFAGYKTHRDLFKVEEIEAASDVIVWSTDAGPAISARRPQDKSFIGNIVEAMSAYARGALGETSVRFQETDRIIAIGSDRMMAAVQQARHNVLKPFLKETHVALASINSPMQCMMKEVCAQCLQRHHDPATGAPAGAVFTCFNQDQKMDEVDFSNLNARLKQNSVQEKLTNLWLDYLLSRSKELPV